MEGRERGSGGKERGEVLTYDEKALFIDDLQTIEQSLVLRSRMPRGDFK